MSQRGDGDPGSPGSAPGRGPSPAEIASQTARSHTRLRALRAAILFLAVALVLYLVREIWIWKKASPPVATATASPPTSPDTVQTLDRFEFSSAFRGKKDYSISADRLRGIEGGMRFVEGIRSVEIVRPDGKTLSGSADRGSFAQDQDKIEHSSAGRLVLEGNVRIVGPGGETVETDRMEFSRDDRTLTAPGPSRFALNGSWGTAGRLVYDLKDKVFRAGDGMELHYASPGEPDMTLRAPSAVAAAGGEYADLDGGVTLRRGADELSGPALHIETQAGAHGPIWFTMGAGVHGRLVRATPLERPGRAGGTARSASANEAGATLARPVILAAERLEGAQEKAGGARTLTLRGAASVREDMVAPTAGTPRELSAATITIAENGRDTRRRLTAEGDVAAVFPATRTGPSTAAAPAPRALTCKKLDMTTLADGSIERADAEGDVRLSADGRTAFAGRATLLGETRSELRGGRPRVEEGSRSLVADEIDILNKEGRIDARGRVRSRFVPDAKGGGGLFLRGEPIEISADSAILQREPRTGTFTGGVVARQGVRALSAAKLVLEDTGRTAHAEGSVSLRSVRLDQRRGDEHALDRPDPSPPAGSSGAPANAGQIVLGETGATEIPVRIDADTLDYDEATRTAHFSGHAVYREPGRLLSAGVITIANDEDKGRFRDANAEGSVHFEGEGKRGSSDAAHYRASDRTVVLEGKDRPAEVVEIATGRIWRGASLTWVLAADSIPVVTGEQWRTRVTGAVQPARREPSGTKADGGTPR